MVNINRILKEYNCEISLKEMKQHLSDIRRRNPENEQKISEREISSIMGLDPVIWPDNFLPYTKYMKNKTNRNMEKIERWAYEPLKLKTKKLVQILTQTDLDLIKILSAEDLISYDGNNGSRAVQHIQNKGKALIVLFSTEFRARTLFKMLKHAIIYKNYNLIHLLVKALQTKSLSRQKVQKVLHYKKLLDTVEGGIFPLGWMLKDCEDSNLNIESEVASLRFCKIIDKLKEMKKLEFNFKVREKGKQIVYSRMWNIVRRKESDLQTLKYQHENLYLVL